MRQLNRYVFVCPACGGTTRQLRVEAARGGFREPYSLVDGKQYPSCRQIEQLCYWCEVDGWSRKDKTWMRIPDRKGTAQQNGSSSSSAMSPGLFLPFSELVAFLKGSDGQTGAGRLPGNLSLKLQSGNWGLSLNDPETGQYVFLEGTSLDDLLLMAEAGLETGTLPWRVSSYANGKKKGK